MWNLFAIRLAAGASKLAAKLKAVKLYWMEADRSAIDGSPILHARQVNVRGKFCGGE